MGIKSEVSRPRPSSTWSFPWIWYGRKGLEIQVLVSHAADMPSDEENMPNSVTITSKNAHRPDFSFRLTRKAAGDLREALDQALSWNGEG